MYKTIAAVVAVILVFGFTQQTLAHVKVKNYQGLCLFARGVDHDDRAIWMSNMRKAVNGSPYVPGMVVQICHSYQTACLDCRGLHDAKWYNCYVTRNHQSIYPHYNKKKQFVISGAKCKQIRRDRI